MNDLHRCSALACAAVALAAGAALAPTQRADDLHWSFAADGRGAGFATNAATPALAVEAERTFGPADAGGGLVFDGSADAFEVVASGDDAAFALPAEAFTIAAWFAVETPTRWGGLASCIQDNGSYEKGWVLGYDGSRFTIGLSTAGADDGDGLLTYLRGMTPYGHGALHHVAATYDGATLSLYVDGQLDASTTEQSGAVLYDQTSKLVIGAYRDFDEDHPLDGRLVDLWIAPHAQSAAEVATAHAARPELASAASWTNTELGFLVEPYLTWPTLDAVSCLCETTVPSEVTVGIRRDTETELTLHPSTESARLHELRIEGLEPDTKYFYEVVARDAAGREIRSPLLSFRTAASPGKPFTFVVIGDTQSQPEVVARCSELAHMHRPNLVVHAGDLVSTGSTKSDWTGHFFPNMQPLIAHAPLMPVLGNHEQDAEHYYRYMSLPEPERWYAFRYGDAEFFMIDGNRDLSDQSAQLAWLEEALSNSVAPWKFAVLHQPPYTSDSDDYGDTTTGPSTRGDLNVRNIATLLEQYGVDICFSGHVHDYERTFPIKGGEVTSHEKGGVVYVTCAGGGGHLEDFDRTNTWFGHKKAHYHHICYVAVNGDLLEFQAIDERGRLFDVATLRLSR